MPVRLELATTQSFGSDLILSRLGNLLAFLSFAEYFQNLQAFSSRQSDTGLF